MSRGKRTDVVRCSCVQCGREMSNVGLITHLARSHDNDTRFLSSGHIAGNPNHRGANQYTKAKDRGEIVTLSADAKDRISKAALEHNAKFWTDERRTKHSDSMLAAVKRNPESYNYENVCRRVERFEYKGNYLHSSWEVEVAKYLDANDIKWTRKVESFDYEWEGKVRQYFPDFYLPDSDLYLEVKGYEIPKDRAKWSQFPKKLRVLKYNEIKMIQNGTFNGAFV